MSCPKVSVIIPSYNQARYLGEAIESVLGQTYRNIELIVINDGSTDDSLKMARSYGDSLRLIDQSNQGRSAARNRGIEAATGAFIKFLDADDLLDRECIRLQLQAMGPEDPWNESEIWVFEDRLTVRQAEARAPTPAPLATRLLMDGIPPAAPLVRAPVIKSQRFRLGCWYGEDQLFWNDVWQWLGHPRTMPFVSQARYYYRIHPEQTTARKLQREWTLHLCQLLESWEQSGYHDREALHLAMHRLAYTLSTCYGYEPVSRKDEALRARRLMHRISRLLGNSGTLPLLYLETRKFLTQFSLILYRLFREAGLNLPGIRLPCHFMGRDDRCDELISPTHQPESEGHSASGGQ